LKFMLAKVIVCDESVVKQAFNDVNKAVLEMKWAFEQFLSAFREIEEKVSEEAAVASKYIKKALSHLIKFQSSDGIWYTYSASTLNVTAALTSWEPVIAVRDALFSNQPQKIICIVLTATSVLEGIVNKLLNSAEMLGASAPNIDCSTLLDLNTSTIMSLIGVISDMTKTVENGIPRMCMKAFLTKAPTTNSTSAVPNASTPTNTSRRDQKPSNVSEAWLNSIMNSATVDSKSLKARDVCPVIPHLIDIVNTSDTNLTNLQPAAPTEGFLSSLNHFVDQNPSCSGSIKLPSTKNGAKALQALIAMSADARATALKGLPKTERTAALRAMSTKQREQTLLAMGVDDSEALIKDVVETIESDARNTVRDFFCAAKYYVSRYATMVISVRLSLPDSVEGFKKMGTAIFVVQGLFFAAIGALASFGSKNLARRCSAGDKWRIPEVVTSVLIDLIWAIQWLTLLGVIMVGSGTTGLKLGCTVIVAVLDKGVAGYVYDGYVEVLAKLATVGEYIMNGENILVTCATLFVQTKADVYDPCMEDNAYKAPDQVQYATACHGSESFSEWLSPMVLVEGVPGIIVVCCLNIIVCRNVALYFIRFEQWAYSYGHSKSGTAGFSWNQTKDNDDMTP